MKSAQAFYGRILTNPLLAPLRDVPRGKQLKIALAEEMPPKPTAEIRNAPVSDRLTFLSVLRQVHVPLGRDIMLADLIRDVIEDNYTSRVFDAEASARLKAAIKALPDRVDVVAVPEATGIALIGYPGGGKSRTAKRVLRLYPQTALMPVNEDPRLPVTIVVWLWIECASNLTITALIQAIFSAIERATGEPLPPSTKKGNRSELIQQVAEVCHKLCIGVLVIDEIQHVLNSRNEVDKKMINFIVELSNAIGTPLLLIGTSQAQRTIAKALRSARRMTGPVWKNLEPDSIAWRQFIANLLAYQFTREFTPTAELAPKVYELSQGLPQIAAMLWRITQRVALMLELDGAPVRRVDAALLESVFDQHFSRVKPLLDAIRSKDPARIALVEDLCFDEDDLEAEIIEEAERHAAQIKRTLEKKRKAALVTGGRIIRDAVLAQTQALIEDAAAKAESGPVVPALSAALAKAQQNGEDPAAAVLKATR